MSWAFRLFALGLPFLALAAGALGLVAAADLMRTVVVLAAVAALLAAFLLFVDRRPAGDGAGAGGRARLIDAFDRAGVRRVTIARAGAAAFSLERQPPGHEPTWGRVPGDNPADAAAVEDLLGAIDLGRRPERLIARMRRPGWRRRR